MNIFVYTDESGVFDNKHEEIYVFGGVIFWMPSAYAGGIFYLSL